MMMKRNIFGSKEKKKKKKKKKKLTMRKPMEILIYLSFDLLR